MSLVGLAAAEAGAAWALWRLRARTVGRSGAVAVGTLAAATALALVIGTAWAVPGVPLAIPLLAGVIWVAARSPWRLGDLTALALAAAVGSALGYALAAAREPDTGSYGDQTALLLALIALPLAAWVWIRGRLPVSGAPGG